MATFPRSSGVGDTLKGGGGTVTGIISRRPLPIATGELGFEEGVASSDYAGDGGSATTKTTVVLVGVVFVVR